MIASDEECNKVLNQANSVKSPPLAQHSFSTVRYTHLSLILAKWTEAGGELRWTVTVYSDGVIQSLVKDTQDFSNAVQHFVCLCVCVYTLLACMLLHKALLWQANVETELPPRAVNTYPSVSISLQIKLISAAWVSNDYWCLLAASIKGKGLCPDRNPRAISGFSKNGIRSVTAQQRCVTDAIKPFL